MHQFRIINLPPFRAASSGLDKDMDFSPSGVLGKFNAWFSTLRPEPRDDFMPRDFLYYDHARGGFVWIWIVNPGEDTGGFELEDGEGGWYLTYVYRDGDEEEGGKQYQAAMTYIQSSEHLELDERPGHYTMGHIITPAPLIEAQGWSQMETFIPVRRRQAA